MATGPLVRGERALPEPGPRDLVLRVEARGGCRTELHLAEGDPRPHRPS
jgi:alcohol dehydrogenase, propanol-preferring